MRCGQDPVEGERAVAGGEGAEGELGEVRAAVEEHVPERFGEVLARGEECCGGRYGRTAGSGDSHVSGTPWRTDKENNVRSLKRAAGRVSWRPGGTVRRAHLALGIDRVRSNVSRAPSAPDICGSLSAPRANGDNIRVAEAGTRNLNM